MKKVVVASKNPVKINATQLAFKKMMPNEAFLVEGVSVSSDVSDQPMTDEETFRGALNRAKNAQNSLPDADFWVGLEGGIEPKGDAMEAFAWIVVMSSSGVEGRGRTGSFFLPPVLTDLIKQGKELGEANDIVFNSVNSKQSGGAVGLLTQNIVTRTSYYETAVIFALVPFSNPKLYSNN